MTASDALASVLLIVYRLLQPLDVRRPAALILVGIFKRTSENPVFSFAGHCQPIQLEAALSGRGECPRDVLGFQPG